jgi:hypothetical protein
MIENVGNMLTSAAEGVVNTGAKHEPILQATSGLGHRVLWYALHLTQSRSFLIDSLVG